MQEEQKIKQFKNRIKSIIGQDCGETESYMNISVDSIMPNPYQPRRKFDITALNELADSIAQIGVISPISVRKAPGGYELVCGERRWRAAKMAGLKTIPAIVVNLSDRDSAIVAITENLQRKELTFFEEAESMNNLIEFHDMTQEMVAEKLGKSQGAVANKMRLLKLPKKIQSMIMEAGLCERHARALLRLPTEEMQEAAAYRIAQSQMTVSAAEKMIQKMLEDEPKRKLIKSSGDGFEKAGLLFKNTMNKTIEMMKKSGMSPFVAEKEEKDYIEYVIKLEKNKVSAIKKNDIVSRETIV